MRKDSISSFSIEICRSTLHKLDFAIIVPPGIVLEIEKKSRLAQAYIDYDLAIKPNVPVVIFQLETLLDVGSKLYGGNVNCPKIYHLPPRMYTDLEEIVAEGAFCVSESYLEYVIKSKCLNRSIFGLLEQTRQELGLNVIGIQHELTE